MRISGNILSTIRYHVTSNWKLVSIISGSVCFVAIVFQLIRKRPYSRDDDDDDDDEEEEDDEEELSENSENSYDEIESEEEYQTFDTESITAKEWKQYRNERIKVEYGC